MKKVAMVFVLCAALLCCGCSGEECDPRSQQALSNLMQRMGFGQDNEVSFWIDFSRGDDGHKHYDAYALKVLGEHQSRINELKKWASSLPDPKDKTAYLYWIDWYQDGLNEARKEYYGHSNLNEMNAYELEQIRCEKSRHALEVKHKMPVPPR